MMLNCRQNCMECENLSISSVAPVCRLRADGVLCKEVTVGSTPSCHCPSDNMSLLTEIHPGNYVFNGNHSFNLQCVFLLEFINLPVKNLFSDGFLSLHFGLLECTHRARNKDISQL